MQKKRTGSDRSGDRFIHDIVSSAIGGAENRRRDQPIDQGVRAHGSAHRLKFPHRNIAEATAYLCWQDIVNQKKIDVPINFKITCGHFIVDSLPAKMKERMKLIQSLAGMFA